jgi:hypothetical protein
VGVVGSPASGEREHRSGGDDMRRRLRLVAVLLLLTWVASPAATAAAFGTIDSGGQHHEHQRITRAALACAGDAAALDDCLEPASIDFLAGHDKEFGGVGAPDSDEISDPAAHCDDADYLEAGYPQTRQEATVGLLDCVDHLRMRLDEAVDDAQGLLDDEGHVVAAEVDFDAECGMREAAELRAKCNTLEAFGRVLHGVQDFYSHSNWADEADPTRAVGPDNPPGLNLPGPSAVLDLRGETAPDVPAELSTGCYVLPDEVPGVDECADRVTHAALNKDTGLIDPDTGEATDPTKPRGMVGDNFAKAVAGAIAESRRQWQELRAELATRYGDDQAAAMICALTHDDATGDCGGQGRERVLAAGLGAAVAVAIAVMLVRAHRRRRV